MKRNSPCFILNGLIALLFVACASEETNHENSQLVPNTLRTVATLTGQQPLFGLQNNEQTPAKTRTTATHTFHAPAVVSWLSTDKIWVKATDGTFYQSAAAQFSSTSPINYARANFTLTSGNYGFNPEVRYTNGSSADEVVIAAQQIQSTGNNFDHLGVSGDCGAAISVGGGGDYEFTLQHKVSYLCLLPRAQSGELSNCKVTKIDIIADNDIAGTYSFTNGTLSVVPTGNASKSIRLTTGTGFTLTNVTSMNDNAAYVVIAPGTHELIIKYWLKTPDNLEGTVTKHIPSQLYDAGSIYDFTANLDVRAYHEKYYMFDAADGQDYWAGNEAFQPYVVGNQDEHYAHNNSDPRWFNPIIYPTEATRSARNCPNVNEISWYVMRGEIHWDADELFCQNGHYYKGGAWILKKSEIAGFNTTTAADGANYTNNGQHCTLSQPVAYGTPAANQINRYFFKPAIGHYYLGRMMNSMGAEVLLRTKSQVPDVVPRTYVFKVSSSRAEVDRGDYCDNGLTVWTAE